jgi:hypothetical protein
MKKNGSAARANVRLTTEHPPGVTAAEFASIPIEPIDAPMWPIHPPGWLQLDVPASAPSWSGLHIERRNRIPAPDLLYFPLEPLDRCAQLDDRCEALPVAAGPKICESGLEPLGWDPRAFCVKKEVR